MTSSADIVTEIRDSALVIPIQSVADSTSGQKYTPDKDGFVQVVFVVDDAKVTARQVMTGIQSETHIEIKEGLAEGDEIVTGNYRAISQLLQNNSRIKIEESKEITYAAK